jgi:DNA invertase Pin-like site-specific DNA recombinase
MRIGYSYIRYSSNPQEEGDSVRRQTKGTREWCDRNGVTLDESATLIDRAKSAYHGRHRTKGHLARFLADVEAGDVPRGSVLIVENLDRLSRENPWDAVPMLCNIVNAGVTVQTLSPSEMTFQRGRDLTPLVLAVVEFCRAHSESASKADRGGANWDGKKEQARLDGTLITRRLPAWLAERDGRAVPVPGRVAVVRRMFDLATSGVGLSLIVKELTGKVAPWGRGGWSKAYVHKVIAGKAVLGLHQPMKNGKPDGAPFAYYPAVIDEGLWHRAQAALSRRRDRPGPVGVKVAYLFAGLLFDAQTRSRMLISHQTRGRRGARVRARVLVSADSMEGRARSVSFPYAVFEEAVLGRLAELSAAEVIGSAPEAESGLLAAEAEALRGRMQLLEDQLAGDGDVPSLARVLKALDGRLQDVQRRLAEARRKEATPLTAAWSEAVTLLDVARDERRRLRLRDLLRQLISEAWVLVVRRGCHALCALQLFFTANGARSYLIHYKAAGRGREGGWSVASFADADLGDSPDLRDPVHAGELAAELAALDLSRLG